MNIQQIPVSTIFPESIHGKWYCSQSKNGPDNEPVHRYLQGDGTWGKTTHYFDNEIELQTALDVGIEPDFTLTGMDLHYRSVIRDDMELGDRELDDEPTRDLLQSHWMEDY